MKKKHHTYMWQEVRGEPTFRIQTDDPRIIKKLSRRKEVKLTAFGMNNPIRIFIITFSKNYNAKRSFIRLTGNKLKNDPVAEGFQAATCEDIKSNGGRK